MLGGRKVRSNKGKKRGQYKSRKGSKNINIRHASGRKVRSNKGKKRGPYGPRTGRTRSGRKFRGGIRPRGHSHQSSFKGTPQPQS